MKLSEIISELEENLRLRYSSMHKWVKDVHLPALKALNDEDWVSVEDRLPECFRVDGKKKFQNWVLGIKGKSQFVCIYTKGHELEYGDEDPSDEEYDEIEERNGCLYLKAGWYELEETPRGEYDETWVARNPTHWRPLPTPPNIENSNQ